MLTGPFKRIRIFDQFIEWLTVAVEVLDIAATKTKASKVFQYISFALRRFLILHVFHSFHKWLNSLFGDNVA